jgi:hypothetical protein
MSFVVIATGVAFLTMPVRVARLAAWLNRGSPGELMKYNRLDVVGQSWRIRLEYRIAGALMIAFGILVLAGEFGI